MGCHFLLQEIFPTQELNLGFPHCRLMLYRLSQGGRYYLSLKPWLRLRPSPEGAKGKVRFLPQLISNFLPYLVPALPTPPQAVSSLRAELGWGHIYLGTEHSVNLNTEWKTDSDIGVLIPLKLGIQNRVNANSWVLISIPPRCVRC